MVFEVTLSPGLLSGLLSSQQGQNKSVMTRTWRMGTNGVSQEDRHILLSVAIKKTKLFTVSTDARHDLLAPWGKR